MGLEKYWSKRNFARTPEPHGEVAPAADRLRFVIQKHAASHLHYDFRLEIEGTLKSWAIPKGPSLDPQEKRLAVEVEDHPLDYGSFEGKIPEGEYGGGTVLLWDRGTWTPDGDPAEGYRKGRLKFRLDGEKLEGQWALVRMASRGEKRTNWLLVKSADEFAREGDAAGITERRAESVLTGRALEEIEADKPAPARKRRPKTTGLVRTAGRATATKASDGDAGARNTAANRTRGRTPLPAFIPPQLATLVARAPAQGEWLAEMKFDGYRLLARIAKKKAELWTRNQKDWTARLPELAAELARLPVQNAWLDGELIAVDAQGRSSFSLLQQALGRAGRQQRDIRLLLYVFDLLFLDGHDLRGLPQRERKQLLRELVGQGASMLRYSEHLEGQVADAHRRACRHGEEGVIVKRADAAYLGERSSHWLKLKCGQRQEFVIGGYTDPAGTRKEFGALLVGYYTAAGELVYAGRVGTGFNSELLGQLGPKLRRLERRTPAFAVPPTRTEIRGAHWVSPELVADLRFAGWTRLDRLRQAAFLGLREDKPAGAVRRELPEAPPGRGETAAGRAERGSARYASATLALRHDTQAQTGETAAEKSASQPRRAVPDTVVTGVTITHPSRLVFPAAGVPAAGPTKLDVARYYEAVADWLLPELKDRPLTLLRCPQGLQAECFIQRHLTESLPESLQPVAVSGEEGGAQYMTADSLTAVLDLVQMGVLELHTWGARRDRLDRPDRMIFDLDPAPDVEWRDFVAYAHLVRKLLQEFGLPAFLKTTGGKGVHVEVPLRREHTWEAVKDFSQGIAQLLAKQLPDYFIAKAAKQARHGRVFVDYLRNAASATAVAAYSTRARAGAPVALPLYWDELPDTPPGTWALRNVPARLAEQKQSPWRDYEKSRTVLGTALFEKLGLEAPAH